MKEPDRLNDFYYELREIHKRHFPDWRFGQFMYNFLNWLYSEKHLDPFFPEEGDMIDYLKEYATGEKKK